MVRATAINLLILLALGWSAHKRSVVGMVLAAILPIRKAPAL
jgi:hypothetical protein